MYLALIHVLLNKKLIMDTTLVCLDSSSQTHDVCLLDLFSLLETSGKILKLHTEKTIGPLTEYGNFRFYSKYLNMNLFRRTGHKMHEKNNS